MAGSFSSTLVMAALGVAQAGEVSGVVRDEGGAPVSGMDVCVYDTRLAYACAETNPDGEYRIDHLPAESYRIRAIPTGDQAFSERYWPNEWAFCDGERIVVPENGGVEDLNFSLPTAGGITGLLLDADGQAVANARIVGEGADAWTEGQERETRTDETGVFVLQGLTLPETDSCAWRLYVEADGFPGQYWGAVNSAEEAALVEVEPSNIRDIGSWILLPGVTVSGTVRSEDGDPISGASVHVYSNGQVVSVESGEDGSWVAVGLPPGNVLPWASATGWATTYYPNFDRPTEYLPVEEEGEHLEGADLELPLQAVFSGQILGDGDLSEATALLYNDEGTVGFGAPVAKDGTFEIEGLHGGRYQLFLYAADVGFTNDYVRDESGEIAWFELEEGIYADRVLFSLPLGAVLEGTLTDDRGEPVYGAYVWAIDEDTGEIEVASSDRDGKWTISGLPPGYLTLEARYTAWCDADPGWVTVWWPGTPNELLAARIVVEEGEHIDGLDLVLPYDGDHDGMSDAWEESWGLDPSRDDASEDLDGDGWTNLQEYLNGTDPTRPEEPTRIRTCRCGTGTSGKALFLPVIALVLASARRRWMGTT